MKKVLKTIFVLTVLITVFAFIKDVFFYESVDSEVSSNNSTKEEATSVDKKEEDKPKRPYGYNMDTFYSMVNDGELNVSYLELNLIKSIEEMLVPIFLNPNNSKLASDNFYTSAVCTNQEGTEFLLELTLETKGIIKNQVYVDITTGHLYLDKHMNEDTCNIVTILGKPRDAHGFKISLDEYMRLKNMIYPVTIDLYNEANQYNDTATDYQISDNNVIGQYEEDEYIIRDSNIRKLSEDELSSYSKGELGYIRNEIFARHGYVFKNAGYRKYFESKNWYYIDESFSGDESELSDIEKYNINLIKQIESEL